jgi:hypothetical protein
MRLGVGGTKIEIIALGGGRANLGAYTAMFPVCGHARCSPTAWIRPWCHPDSARPAAPSGSGRGRRGHCCLVLFAVYPRGTYYSHTNV